MATLKNIDIMSLAKILAVVYAILGLIIAVVLVAFGGAFAAVFGTGTAKLFGVGIAILFTIPVFLLIFGFAIGAIEAWLYNVVAERLGGIGIVLKKGELKRIDPLSAGKIAAVLGILFGFILGVIFAIAASVSGSAAFVLAGIGIVILFMIIFPIIFFVAVALECIIYNYIASKIGGVMLYFKGKELKKIGVMQYAKIEGIFGAIGGLIEGVAFTLRWAFAPASATMPSAVHVLGALSIIVFPIIYFITTFIFAAIESLLYNSVVPSIGGVKLTIS